MQTSPDWVAWLPTVNALLNASAAVLLVCGFQYIRRQRVGAHRACMLAALTTSLIFLASYLTLHFHIGATSFRHQGLIRVVYFAVLLSHTGLAMALPPFVLVTLVRALRGKFRRHAAIARWTLPIWLYVSVTGVVVYLMLYHLHLPLS